jgi:glutamyl-tRNA synthetase
LPDTGKIRVRFAPSPTGHLHIGGARTALFNWLFARGRGGTFVLRIEDTDRSRSTEEYIESILDGMRWLGLDWDEGPYRQTERFDRYREHIERLLLEGKAYRCYCTAEELEERRKKALAEGRPVKYDRRCLDLKEALPGRAASVRFKMPTLGNVVVEDMIKGNITFDNSQLDDLIIMRSDGTPTYNFVVVVDDVDMDITHVIRGDDHLNNTPKQVHICRALGHEPPRFGHLPMILGSDKTRLSKRHGATSVIAYREEGYLPQALVNYLARLGWSHGDQEVFSREELIKLFSLDNVGKSAAVFNPEKLLWLNAEYLKTTPPEELAELVVPFLLRHGTVSEGSEPDKEYLSKAVATLVERARTLDELARKLRFYLIGDEDIEFEEKGKAKFLNEKTAPYLADVGAALSALDEFNHDSLKAAFEGVMEKHGVKLGKVAQPVRVALTGGTESPGIFEVMEILGKERTLGRLERAISSIRESAHE